MKKGEIAGKIFLGVFSIAFLTLAVWSGLSMVTMSRCYNYTGRVVIQQDELANFKATTERYKDSMDILSSSIGRITEYDDGRIGVSYHFYSEEPNVLGLAHSKDSTGGVALMLIPLLLEAGVGTFLAVGALKGFLPAREEWEEDNTLLEGNVLRGGRNGE